MDHNEPCIATRGIALRGVGDGGDVAFRGSSVLLPADGVRVLLRPLLLRQERALLLAPGDKDIRLSDDRKSELYRVTHQDG